MDGPVSTGEPFVKREVPLPDLRTEKIFPGGVRVQALFQPEYKWRLMEEFGPDSFEPQPDGRLLFRADYTDRESLLTWLLTFGDKAELLEPREMRQELRAIAEGLCRLYEKGEKNYGLSGADS